MKYEYFNKLIGISDDSKYVATDSDGLVYAFTDKPVYHIKTGKWCSAYNTFEFVAIREDLACKANDSCCVVKSLQDTGNKQ